MYENINFAQQVGSREEDILCFVFCNHVLVLINTFELYLWGLNTKTYRQEEVIS
jgi:hypothetical protein